MPKKLLADVNESESEYDHDYDASESVAQTLSKLDIQPTEKKQGRILTEEHKAKLLAGRLKATEKRKLENKFGKSTIDRKLQLLEKHGLLKDERLADFNNIYEELTGEIRIPKIVRPVLPNAEKPQKYALEVPVPTPKPSRPITLLQIPKPVTIKKSKEEITPPTPPTPSTHPTPRRVPRRRVQLDPEESQSEFDESEYEEPVKIVKKPIKRQTRHVSEDEYSTSAEVNSDSDLDSSYFDMSIFNDFGNAPQRQFNISR